MQFTKTSILALCFWAAGIAMFLISAIGRGYDGDAIAGILMAVVVLVWYPATQRLGMFNHFLALTVCIFVLGFSYSLVRGDEDDPANLPAKIIATLAFVGFLITAIDVRMPGTLKRMLSRFRR